MFSASLKLPSCFLVALSLLVFPGSGAHAEVSDEQLAPLEKWLAFQRGVRTVKAAFVQSRKLRTLRNPLRSDGTVWIDRRGKRFRWQAGDEDAPKSVAVKTGTTLTLLQPSRKRAKQIDLSQSDAATNPGAAFDFATGEMPDTLTELKQAFSIENIESESGAWRVTLRPLESGLRESLDEVVFLIDGERHHLRGFELTFRDRSVVETIFTRQEFNVALDDALFQPDLSDYTVQEP